MTRPKALLVRVAGIATIVLAAAAVEAQTTGNIEGTVTDAHGGALPGASVEVSGPALQGTRATASDSNGRFRVPALAPGSYKVTASLTGFTHAEKNATVALAGTATVNLELQVAATANVTVTGEAPLIDTRSAATGSTYNSAVISKLPVDRNYASIVLSQPGVQIDSGETQGNHLAISIYGTTSAENTYLINGVNTTNVIKGTQGKDINGEFVQEVQVLTDGYMAEYGRGTGGVINVVTKSGSNEFHGGVFGYYNNFALRSSQKVNVTPGYTQSGDQVIPLAFTSPIFQESDLSRGEAGFDIGGFVVKDRVWFFGAFDRFKEDRRFRTYDTNTQSLLPGDYPDNQVSTKIAGKITANLAEGTTLIGSITTDPSTRSGAGSTTSTPTPESDPGTYLANRYSGGNDYTGQLLQIFGSNAVATLQYGRHEDRFATKPFEIGQPLLIDQTPVENIQVSGNPVLTGGWGLVFGPVTNNQSKRDQIAGNFTYYLGSHELKAGGDWQNDETTGASFYTGGQSIIIHDCTQPGTTCAANAPLHTFTVNGISYTDPVYYEHDYFTASGSDLTPLARAPFDVKTPQWSAYLQDSWRVLPSLTVNAGIRYDEENLKGGNGATAIKFSHEWAPRAGFVWDFTGDGTSKIYGSYGRFYYSIPTDLTVRVFTANTSVVSYNYDPSATSQDPTAPFGQLVQVGTFSGEPIAPGIKAPYQDEYALGVEKALDASFSLGVKFTYRALGRTVEDHCDLDYTANPFGASCAIANPGSDQPLANGTFPSCDNSANPADPNSGQCGLPGVPMPPAKRIFRGIELVARKQLGRSMWAQASYLLSSLKGNYSGAIREADGQTDPGINADYDYGVFLHNGSGYLDLDRRHQIRLDAAYSAPFGLQVGVGAYARSGTPLSVLGYYNSFYPDNVFLTPRGSAGRTPWDYEVNLNLAYSWNAGRGISVTPMIYVFNLLNRQTPTAYDQDFNPNGNFVTDSTSPFYGQPGIKPGDPLPGGGTCQSSVPCSDNPYYRKITARTDPRFLRFAVRIAF
ncbi:MAG TPA: TonB-dependent receptor [Thermoanaerobaculia bacterium]|nr:TonB-dependent receptor [Thermoanaerobaculia bacterium]